MKRLIAAIAVIAIATPAHADPVSIAAAVYGIGSWWASIGIVGQALVGIGISLAATGISYLLNSGKQTERAANSNLPSVNVPERDGLLERSRGYGLFTSPGGVFYQKTVGNGSTSNPSIYVFGVTISEGVCDSLQAVIINGVLCRIDSLGQPIDAPWFDGSTRYFKVSFRAGTDTQAIDPIITARFPTESAEFRQRGVCTVVMEMQFGATADQHSLLWGAGGIPQLLFQVKGLHIYDPRNSAQAADTPSTWAWSDNASLVQADWMRAELGFGIASGDMNWDTVRIAANTDDITFQTLSGPERRGRVNGRAFSSENNADVLDTMALQNRALIRRVDGQYTITSRSVSLTSVATIHQDLLVGDLAYQNEPDTRSTLNSVSVEFQPASRFNQSAEVYYQDTALVALDGQVYERRVSLRFNDSSASAQRLGYGMVVENRAGRTLSMAADIAVIYAPGKDNKQLEIGDVVTVYMRNYQAINGLYMVDKLDITTDFVVQLSMTGYDPNMIDGWSVDKEMPFGA